MPESSKAERRRLASLMLVLPKIKLTAEMVNQRWWSVTWRLPNRSQRHKSWGRTKGEAVGAALKELDTHLGIYGYTLEGLP